MPQQPTYDNSQLAVSLTEMQGSIQQCKKGLIQNAKSAQRDFAEGLLNHITKTLDFITLMAKHFDNRQIPGSATIAMMLVQLGMNKNLINKRELTKQYGSRSFMTYLEMRSIAKQTYKSGREGVLKALQKKNEQIVRDINNKIGVGDPAYYFDTLFKQFEKMGAASFQTKDDLTSAMEVYIEKNVFESYTPHFIPFYIQITDLNVVPAVLTLISQIKQLPTELSELTPFLNPKAIEVNKKTNGLWKKMLDLVSPVAAKMTFSHQPDQSKPEGASYVYSYIPDEETSATSFKVDLDWMYSSNWQREHTIDLLTGMLEEYHLRHAFAPNSPEKTLIDRQHLRNKIINQYIELERKRVQELFQTYTKANERHMAFLQSISTDMPSLDSIMEEQRNFKLIKQYETAHKQWQQSIQSQTLRQLIADVPDIIKELEPWEAQGKRLDFLEEHLPVCSLRFEMEDPPELTMQRANSECGEGYLVGFSPSFQLASMYRNFAPSAYPMFPRPIFGTSQFLSDEQSLAQLALDQLHAELAKAQLHTRCQEAVDWYTIQSQQASDAKKIKEDFKRHQIQLLIQTEFDQAKLLIGEEEVDRLACESKQFLSAFKIENNKNIVTPETLVEQPCADNHQAPNQLASGPDNTPSQNKIPGRPTSHRGTKAMPSAVEKQKPRTVQKPKPHVVSEQPFTPPPPATVARLLGKKPRPFNPARNTIQPNVQTVECQLSNTAPSSENVDRPIPLEETPVPISAAIRRAPPETTPLPTETLRLSPETMSPSPETMPLSKETIPLSPETMPLSKETIPLSPEKIPPSFSVEATELANLRNFQYKGLMRLLEPLHSKKSSLSNRKHYFMNETLNAKTAQRLTELIEGLEGCFLDYKKSKLPDHQAMDALKEGCGGLLLTKENAVFQEHRGLFALFKNLLAALARYFNCTWFQTDTANVVASFHNHFTNSYGDFAPSNHCAR